MLSLDDEVEHADFGIDSRCRAVMFQVLCAELMTKGGDVCVMGRLLWTVQRQREVILNASRIVRQVLRFERGRS